MTCETCGKPTLGPQETAIGLCADCRGLLPQVATAYDKYYQLIDMVSVRLHTKLGVPPHQARAYWTHYAPPKNKAHGCRIVVTRLSDGKSAHEFVNFPKG